MLLVGGERDRELVLGLEFVLRRHRIGGNAENLGAGFGEGAREAREVDRLLGAARGVGPRIEIEDELCGRRSRSAKRFRRRRGGA